MKKEKEVLIKVNESTRRRIKSNSAKLGMTIKGYMDTVSKLSTSVVVDKLK